MTLALASTAATATVLLVAACSAPTPPRTTPDAHSEPSVSATTPAPAPASSPTVTSPTPSATATPAPTEQPVATRPGSFDGIRVSAQLYPVRRSGGTATIDLYIASQNPDDRFGVFDSLGDGNAETGAKELNSVDGIRLIDTTAKKAYLPAVTATGACVCSPDDLSTTTMRSSVWVTVTFAAPPATVSTISVSVPSFGTFTDVPIV